MNRKEASVPQYRTLQGGLRQPVRSAPAKRKETTSYQYPYPAEPKTWNDEERLYGRGLRRLFDILFSRKLQNVMIEDKAINARVIADSSVQIRHLADGFGTDLDISDNGSITSLITATGDAQGTADQAVGDAAVAQGTADQAVSDAAAAQGIADQAVLDAAAAQSTADQAVLDAAAAQGTADQAVSDAAAAQTTADGLTDKLMPIGITIIASTAPTWGTWTQTTVDTLTAWTRTA